MYLYQLTRFLVHKLFAVREPDPDQPRWRFDRQHGEWVEPHLEREAA